LGRLQFLLGSIDRLDECHRIDAGLDRGVQAAQ
jgi:hypothetical protein